MCSGRRRRWLQGAMLSLGGAVVLAQYIALRFAEAWLFWIAGGVMGIVVGLLTGWLLLRGIERGLLMDALPGAVMELDSAGRITRFNQAAASVLGNPVLGEFLPERFDGDGPGLLRQLLEQARNLPPGPKGELETKVSDRRFRLALGAADGQCFVNLTDITEFRAMSDRVQASEERFRSLFSEHPDAVYSLGLDGRFMEANRRTEELTGYPLSELLGEHWSAVVVTEDRAFIESQFSAVLQGEPRSYQCRAYHRSGRKISVQVTNVPMLVSGQVAGVFGIAQDMTERLRLEEKRRLLRASVAQIQDVIIITEMQPLDEPGPRMVFVNEAVKQVAGYSPEELLGRTPRVFQGSETDAATRRRIREALEVRRPVKEVLLNYRKDGTVYWNELEIVPIASPESGGRAYFAAVMRDVSDRKRYELELQRSREELRRLNSGLEHVREEERRRIARDLHDDLGQMLTAMKLDLGMVVDDLPMLPDQHRERLQEMVDFVDEIIEQVREIAANLRPGILDDLGFEAAAEWFLGRCEKRYDLDISWDADADPPGRITGEVATALFRILQESMTNVSRHARASRVDVLYEDLGDVVRLQVQDNGIGFGLRRQSSSGLGLPGMRERVAMLGGEFAVTSSEEEGTCLRVTLPLNGEVHD